MNQQMNWTEEALETLCKMWSEGATASRIGTAIGCGKNAVIGKAHRIGLPTRASPIKMQPRTDKPPRTIADVPPPLPAPIVIAPRLATKDRLRDQPMRFPSMLPGAYARRCQMPLWGDGPPQFRRDGTPRMCHKPSRDERTSYCAECAARVFRRIAA